VLSVLKINPSVLSNLKFNSLKLLLRPSNWTFAGNKIFVIDNIKCYINSLILNIYMSNFMSLIVVILFNTSLHVSGVPCPSSGDTILPGQPLW
jgi:hypothetical protein